MRKNDSYGFYMNVDICSLTFSENVLKMKAFYKLKIVSYHSTF